MSAWGVSGKDGGESCTTSNPRGIPVWIHTGRAGISTASHTGLRTQRLPACLEHQISAGDQREVRLERRVRCWGEGARQPGCGFGPLPSAAGLVGLQRSSGGSGRAVWQRRLRPLSGEIAGGLPQV